MAVIEVNKDNFASEVLSSDKPVVADFYADWCGPCKALRPILEELSGEREDVKFVSVNIDDEDELADEYDVSSIPCVVVFKNGQEAARSIGIKPKDAIEEMVGGA
ncbi:MAG: thioredoxin [Ruminococcus sp.]|nr:thioredoxin [Ruminococcus sp.]MBQ3856118.1 thioredoxin [Ruminococcus sp.]HOO05344.1 thioredoxin [Ruminococcus sp.]